MNESLSKVGIELLGQLKIVKFCHNCEILLSVGLGMVGRGYAM